MNVRPIHNVAKEFAQASQVLATATRSWPTDPPSNTAQLEGVQNQIEGLRRSLIDMRVSMTEKK